MSTSSSAIALLDRSHSVEQLKNNRSVIKELLRGVLVKGINNDYAAIPGTGRWKDGKEEEGKLTLLKPGAEKICSVFGIAVEPVVESIRDGEDVTFRVTCRMTSIGSGVYLGSGIGEASTLESKYAWKAALCDEQFEAEDPHRRRIHYGKVWENRQQVIKAVRQVRENPNDKMNTVLKMAKKRAMIDAVLSVTAASDTFTQDLENMVDQNAGRSSAPVTGTQAEAAGGATVQRITTEQGKKFYAVWKNSGRAVGEVKEYMRIHCGGVTDDRQMEARYFDAALKWAASKDPVPPAPAPAPRAAAAPAAGGAEADEMAAIREMFGYAGVDLAEQASLLQEFSGKLDDLISYLKNRIETEAAGQ